MLSGLTVQNHPLETVLRERFHILSGFYPGQREIIEQLIQGKHVLAIQRTGWGKSLCYQLASLYYPDITIVFSPLKALMRDQCQRCNTAYGIPAAIISSENTPEENVALLAQAIAGKFRILFIAPERLDNADWQDAVQRMHISMIVIDEAHCISTWGHDFRPNYRRIVRLLEAMPGNTPVLALTATANQHVEQDILQQMGNAIVLRGTMQRPNLYLNVVQLRGDEEKLSYLGEVLSQRTDTGIIYTATQGSAAIVATFLKRQGINAEYYHAERAEDIKQDIEKKFMLNQYAVVCSTNALGMGIDKPDIRFVIHYHIPSSPIHYYQEIGRTGRDGKVAWCILLYDPDDMAIQEYFIQNDKPEEKSYEAVLSQLHSHAQGLQKNDLAMETGLSNLDLRNILVDLEEQQHISYHSRTRTYHVKNRTGQLDFSAYEAARCQRQQELAAMQNYALHDTCYMEYLTAYFGSEREYMCNSCGNCQRAYFPPVIPSERIQSAAIHFLNEDYMPCIEKYYTEQYAVHEPGWSLSYHGKSRMGKLVRASKYEDAGPFALGIVFRAVEVCRTRYPMHLISGIVSIPATKSGLLVETFARQVANYLNIEYLDVLAKIRPTQEQKLFTNRRQKADNLKDAFYVRLPELVTGCTLLLIDDIYDSGATMREVGRTLMQAGARAIYPLTITRTIHSDDQ